MWPRLPSAPPGLATTPTCGGTAADAGIFHTYLQPKNHFCKYFLTSQMSWDSTRWLNTCPSTSPSAGPVDLFKSGKEQEICAVPSLRAGILFQPWRLWPFQGHSAFPASLSLLIFCLIVIKVMAPGTLQEVLFQDATKKNVDTSA